jgi:cytochrome c oxidase subunit 2
VKPFGATLVGLSRNSPYRVQRNTLTAATVERDRRTRSSTNRIRKQWVTGGGRRGNPRRRRFTLPVAPDIESNKITRNRILLIVTTSPTSIFTPASTPAGSIFGLSIFVLVTVAVIFVVVFALLTYTVVRFRKRRDGESSEPVQIYGSTQVELAWTVIPVLIVVALFLAAARVIAEVQDLTRTSDAVEVIVTGHQYWWEYRYPQLNIVTANELHLPVSDSTHPGKIFLTLLSADTDHSFWVPRLAGKTDLIPNHPNQMWIDPRETGLFLGQCAQYCGTQHAKMLLRVYVQTREAFDRWVHDQQQIPKSDASSRGQHVFASTACVNCHTISGTAAKGRFGPDLTHMATRDTIAAGAAANTPEQLRRWIRNPDAIKPGSKMPAMGLSEEDVADVATYLETLR